MCWLIEDFHKIREHEKVLFAQSLKIFSDMSDAYRTLKTITIGATETAHQVVNYDPEMTRRVTELHVPLMTAEELRQIITKGQSLLNVDMAAISENVVEYSVGMPSVCHQIALNVCLGQGIDSTQRDPYQFSLEDFKPAVLRYVDDLSDTIRARFDRATARKSRLRFDNACLILTALAAGPVAGMPVEEILDKIHANEPSYPKANLSKYINELSQDSAGPLLRVGADGTCRFAEPVYHTVAKTTLIELPSHKKGSDATATRKSSFESSSYLEQAVASAVLGNIYNDPSQWTIFNTNSNILTFSAPEWYSDLTNVTFTAFGGTEKKKELYVSPRRRTREKRGQGASQHQ